MALASEELPVTVRVTNLSGHKLPTGYGEGRRMWVNLQVRDDGDNLIYESAAYDAGTGTLTEDPEAKVYEVLQGQWNLNGGNTCDVFDDSPMPRHLFHFALNDCVAKDNRIPPLGLYWRDQRRNPARRIQLPCGARWHHGEL